MTTPPAISVIPDNAVLPGNTLNSGGLLTLLDPPLLLVVSGCGGGLLLSTASCTILLIDSDMPTRDVSTAELIIVWRGTAVTAPAAGRVFVNVVDMLMAGTGVPLPCEAMTG